MRATRSTIEHQFLACGFDPFGLVHEEQTAALLGNAKVFKNDDRGEEIKELVRERDGSDSEGCPTKRARANNNALLPPGNDEQNFERPSQTRNRDFKHLEAKNRNKTA